MRSADIQVQARWIGAIGATAAGILIFLPTLSGKEIARSRKSAVGVPGCDRLCWTTHLGSPGGIPGLLAVPPIRGFQGADGGRAAQKRRVLWGNVIGRAAQSDLSRAKWAIQSHIWCDSDGFHLALLEATPRPDQARLDLAETLLNRCQLFLNHYSPKGRQAGAVL